LGTVLRSEKVLVFPGIPSSSSRAYRVSSLLISSSPCCWLHIHRHRESVREISRMGKVLVLSGKALIFSCSSYVLCAHIIVSMLLNTRAPPPRECECTLSLEEVICGREKCVLVLCGKESSLLFILVMSPRSSYPRLYTAQCSSSPLRCHKPALLVIVPAQLHSCSCHPCLLAHLPIHVLMPPLPSCTLHSRPHRAHVLSRLHITSRPPQRGERNRLLDPRKTAKVPQRE
jgi:hypothetical protein